MQLTKEEKLGLILSKHPELVSQYYNSLRYNIGDKTYTLKQLKNMGFRIKIQNGNLTILPPTEETLANTIGRKRYNELIKDYMSKGYSRSEAENLVAIRLASVAEMESPLALESLGNVTYSYLTGKNPQTEMYRLALKDVGYSESLKGGLPSYTAKVLSSPSMREGVYIPLITYGVGSGIGHVAKRASPFVLSRLSPYITSFASKTPRFSKYASTLAKYGLKYGMYAPAGYDIGKTLINPNISPGRKLSSTFTKGLTWYAFGKGLESGLGYKPRTQPTETAETKVPDIYGFSKMSPEQAKLTYRQLALRLHPDRGGSPEAFRLLQESYELYTGTKPPVIRSLLSKIKTRVKTFMTKPTGTELAIYKPQTYFSYKPSPYVGTSYERGLSLLFPNKKYTPGIHSSIVRTGVRIPETGKTGIIKYQITGKLYSYTPQKEGYHFLPIIQDYMKMSPDKTITFFLGRRKFLSIPKSPVLEKAISKLESKPVVMSISSTEKPEKIFIEKNLLKNW